MEIYEIGSVSNISGGGSTNQIGSPPDSIARDWVAVVQAAVSFPVEWVDFTAERIENTVVLDWSTASEKNTEWFHVRRKYNSGNWQELGTLAAAGNSSVLQAYQFEDIDIRPGSYTYQIVQEDVDGTLNYSKNVELKVETDGAIEVYPNPAHDELFLAVALAPSTNFQVKLLDQQGRIVKEKKFETDENARTYSIDISDLSIGIYIVVATTAEYQTVRKILKN